MKRGELVLSPKLKAQLEALKRPPAKVGFAVFLDALADRVNKKEKKNV